MTEFRGPEASPGYRLVRAAQAWRRELSLRLQPYDLTPAQFEALAAVSWAGRANPDPTQQQVADVAGMDRMMISRLIDALAARALVDRIPDPADARVRRLRLTASGRSLVDATTPIARAVDAAMFAGLDVARLREELRIVGERA